MNILLEISLIDSSLFSINNSTISLNLYLPKKLIIILILFSLSINKHILIKKRILYIIIFDDSFFDLILFLI